jgi:hypothetical protein
MTYVTKLMFCGTAGGWSGDVRRLDDSVQQVVQGSQIPQGQYNASSHYSLGIDNTFRKHISSVGPNMSERQSGELSQNGNVELSIAMRFGNVVRVYYRRLIWLLIGHR